MIITEILLLQVLPAGLHLDCLSGQELIPLTQAQRHGGGKILVD